MSLKPRILVVDDELGPRESLRMILRDSYEVVTAENGKQAISCIDSKEIDLIILDIRMPEISGIDLLKKIKKRAPAVEAVMITAYASIDTATEAMRYGALDYLVKPFELAAVRDIVQKGIAKRNMARSVSRQIDELKTANEALSAEVNKTNTCIQKHYRETIDSLVAAVDAKDSYTKGHQERVALLVGKIGAYCNLSPAELETFTLAATLHDIGKIGVAEEILRKKGPLDTYEYALVKKHPEVGAQILTPMMFLKKVIPLVLYHHERYEGSGYPRGLAGENIPLGARIIAVADAIDAMMWNRPYAAAKNINEVRAALQNSSGSQFDPQLVSIVIRHNLLHDCTH